MRPLYQTLELIKISSLFIPLFLIAFPTALSFPRHYLMLSDSLSYTSCQERLRPKSYASFGYFVRFVIAGLHMLSVYTGIISAETLYYGL
ncbi:hypothetical protein ACTQ1U_14275 [Thermoguttaceae bacterium LCP21S3_D4]